MSIFKSCDVRGRYGRDLDPGIAEHLGMAVGTRLGGKRVVVGGDLRPSTKPLKEALVKGLIATGCHVIDVGILPTPAFYFAKDDLDADGGVMVTGSHNPPGDNGFKISLGHWPITEQEMESLQQLISEGAFAQQPGTCEQREFIDRYADAIQRAFRATSPLRVVVDAGNGCFWRVAPQVLRAMGHNVVELFCEPDGRFPGRSPNPAVAANLRTLRKTVLSSGADLGVAYDGDGDRAVFVDERGRVVQNDASIVLFARYLLRRQPAEIVYDLKCSSVVTEEIARAGGQPIMERSGHAFIKTTLLQRGAVFGGEISGHFFFGEIGRDDALYATLLLLELLDEQGRSLAAQADTVPHYAITPDFRLPCAPLEARAIVEELRQAFAQEFGYKVDTLDGVRVAWTDGWALVRPSVTEPLLTLRFEAYEKARLPDVQRTIIARSPRLQKLGVPVVDATWDENHLN